MKQELYKELKDKAFAAKTEEGWREVMNEIKEAVKDDASAAESLRKYCKSILTKKKEYWQKQKSKPQWTAKPKTPVFSDDTQHAIQRMCNAIAAYYEKQTNQQ